ncbi:MAG: hypothetical protein COZ74_04935 [Flavobacteriaceae bacterium CG_4_8_14_3_um_filter_31_8]|nr:MAG: hypothetical protein AUK46_02935 [Flavobacteriaceae bacterium CG2_30_31_66]PIX13723.1 MAG: hypothetical protein COZ74_04935 [Flavobacteriaceae bacterium CG_4_8_14_3_um_filter_31_8]
MNIFLKLKHWQIFLIWIFGAIQLFILINTEFWFISFGIYCILLFGWIYSIGKVLNSENSELIKKLNIWSIIYLISIIPFGIQYHNMFSYSNVRINSLFSVLGGILSFISIIKVGIISAKSLKRNEKQENLTFGNYAMEFFLILYLIVGIWVLQPKLNKLIMKK